MVRVLCNEVDDDLIQPLPLDVDLNNEHTCASAQELGYFVLPALQQCIAIEATCANDKACHFQTTGLKLNRPLCVQSNKLLALFWLGRSFKIQVQTAGPGDVRRVSNHLIILGALVEVCHEGPKVFLGLLVKKKVHKPKNIAASDR